MLGVCKSCGGPAIEQVRGRLSETDKGWVPPSLNGQETSNHPVNAADTRVTCAECDNATGWNKGDFADYTRFVWNRDHAAQS